MVVIPLQKKGSRAAKYHIFAFAVRPNTIFSPLPCDQIPYFRLCRAAKYHILVLPESGAERIGSAVCVIFNERGSAGVIRMNWPAILATVLGLGFVFFVVYSVYLNEKEDKDKK
ncbi:MAG: hypothetical protein KDJ38_00020 [Gammaproteobacteria bacterium]|nr:hypothetical protein [Gammaproteobacteria bacterium]